MKMRNMLAMLLALAICFSMASCGKKNADVPDTSAETVSNAEPETVSEVESATATQAEDTTAATEVTSADEPKVTASNKSNTNNSKKSNNTSKSGGGSDSSAKKPNGGSSSGEQAKQETPVATPQKENYDWSQAEVDALIAEAYAYGRTLGLEPTTNLTPNNSSWNQPVCTWLGKQKTINGVKSEIRHLKQLAEREGITLTGPCYQIYAERYYEAAAGGYCWQFYVMR